MDKLTIAYILEVQSLIQLICNLKFSSKHIKKVKETGKGNLRAVYITLTRLALQKEGLCTVFSPQVFDTWLSCSQNISLPRAAFQIIHSHLYPRRQTVHGDCTPAQTTTKGRDSASEAAPSYPTKHKEV